MVPPPAEGKPSLAQPSGMAASSTQSDAGRSLPPYSRAHSWRPAHMRAMSTLMSGSKRSGRAEAYSSSAANCALSKRVPPSMQPPPLKAR